MDKQDWQTKGYSKYGASMGRRSAGLPHGRVSLRRVPIDGGGYDPGGAYWGSPSNLWCASGDGFVQYFRADNRNAAKELVKNMAADEVSFYK